MTVYFVRRDGSDLIKIGATKNVGVRLVKLRQQLRSPVHLVRQIPGGFRAETEIHRVFSRHRVSGEWFRFHSDMMTVVASDETVRFDEIRYREKKQFRDAYERNVLRAWIAAGWVPPAQIRPELME